LLYVPILKCKQGEKDALFTLKETIKDNIVPLLEITPDVIEKGNFNGIEDFWKERLFIFDVSPEYRGELTNEEYLELFNKCNNQYAIPTIRMLDNEEKITTLLSQTTNGLALRLYLEEILDDDFESIFKEFSEILDLPTTDLIIDAQYVQPAKINETAFLIRGAIALIRDISKFRNIIFSSNSFPKALDVERYKLTAIPRIESSMFEKVKVHLEKSGVKLVYSDYSINHWSFFEFIVGIQPSFNIRYSTKDYYVIYKGDTNKKGGLKIDKVKEGCELLATSQYYLGSDFSWGDNEINEKVTGESTKSGNLTTWRAIGTNHHITFIVDLLSSQS
jgi:hypothetical protein